MMRPLCVFALVIMVACAGKKEHAESTAEESSANRAPNLEFKSPIQAGEIEAFLEATGFMRGLEDGSIRLAALRNVDDKYVYNRCEDLEPRHIIFSNNTIPPGLLPALEFTTDDDYRYSINWIAETEKNKFVIAYSYINDGEKEDEESEGEVFYATTQNGKHGFWILKLDDVHYVSRADLGLFETVDAGC
jgi:hypothetical protein